MRPYAKKTIPAIAGLGALALLAVPAAAHGPDGQGAESGPGVMGPKMMHAMMHGAPGPVYGMGYGFGPCAQHAAVTGEDLDVDDVRARAERWLAAQGNERLKLGQIEAVNDDTITVEIVTVDDSLVQKLAFDRHTGWTRPIK